ncbi:MAG: HIT family protein [Bdellovibrio sp.]
MASLFTRIIQGELPAYRVFENDRIISFLALDQIRPGHCLVVPKLEVNHWTEVPWEDFQELHRFSQHLGKSLLEVTKCRRILTSFVGFEVPHCHLHLIPAWDVSDLNFAKAQRLAESEMQTLCSEIRQNLQKQIPSMK